MTPVIGQAGTATITVTVSDGTDSASETFLLTVNAAPTISNISDQVINEDTSTGPIAFTVGDLETPPGSLVVTRSSSNQALVPNASVVLGGSGANRTVAVTPLANQFGSTTITVTATDGVGQSRQDTFVVTVNPINDAPNANILGVPVTTAYEGQSINLIRHADRRRFERLDLSVERRGLDGPGDLSEHAAELRLHAHRERDLHDHDGGDGQRQRSEPAAAGEHGARMIAVENAFPLPLPGGPYNVFSGGSVQLFGSSTDQGAQDTVTLKWDLDLDGLFGETGAAATRGNESLVNPIYFAPSVTALSFFTVRLQATDDEAGAYPPGHRQRLPAEHAARLQRQHPSDRGGLHQRARHQSVQYEPRPWLGDAATEFDSNESTEPRSRRPPRHGQHLPDPGRARGRATLRRCSSGMCSITAASTCWWKACNA